MKKCKKTILIVIILLISMISNVYANEPSESAEITLKSDKTSVKIGERVAIIMSANHENGISMIDSILEYDKTKLELVKVEMKNDFYEQSETDSTTGETVFKAIFSGDEGLKEVEYAELTFKVLKEVSVGEELSIKLLNVNIIDNDLETEFVGEKEIAITVIGEKELEEKKNESNGEEKKPTNVKDKTTADKNINQAGIEGNTIGLIIIGGTLAITFYIKYKKYKDIY